MARPDFTSYPPRQPAQAVLTNAAKYWSFMLAGAVDVPLMLSYADLLTLPAHEIDCTIVCAANPAGAPHIAPVRWRGAALKSLLNETGIDPHVRCAHLHAADGYTTCIDMHNLESALLAYQRDGAALPPDHGSPVRLIVPGLYGYKLPKAIQRIILAEKPIAGVWEKRGWPSEGHAQIASAIHHPVHRARIRGSTTLTGTAYAGIRAVSSIEVSIDSGPWMPIPFSQTAPAAPARWSIDWAPPAPGQYNIRVRATDSHGVTQSVDTGPLPYGSPAIHSIVVQVED